MAADLLELLGIEYGPPTLGDSLCAELTPAIAAFAIAHGKGDEAEATKAGAKLRDIIRRWRMAIGERDEEIVRLRAPLSGHVGALVEEARRRNVRPCRYPDNPCTTSTAPRHMCAECVAAGLAAAVERALLADVPERAAMAIAILREHGGMVLAELEFAREETRAALLDRDALRLALDCGAAPEAPCARVDHEGKTCAAHREAAAVARAERAEAALVVGERLAARAPAFAAYHAQQAGYGGASWEFHARAQTWIEDVARALAPERS